jgi:Flp pilus assembly protein TadD
MLFCSLSVHFKSYNRASLFIKKRLMKMNFCVTPRRSRPLLRKTLNLALAVAGLLGTLCVMPVFADESADVSKLLKGGQYAEALTKANAALAQKPRDAQMRFLKGVALTELNKPSEAIAVFARLSEDFPDLPEPHNNLAVLYASSGQFDKARASLDMAMRTNPSYATAFENLGDVNAKMASQAYDKALQLDPRNSSAKSKLTMLTTLGNDSKAASASAKAAPVVKAAMPAAPAPVPAAAPAPVLAAAPAVAKSEKTLTPAAASVNAANAANVIAAKKFVPTGDYGRGSMPTPRPVAPVVAVAPAPALPVPPVAVAKPAVPTPPVAVAVASVTPAAKPLPVQAAPASVTKPVISTPPAAVASVTPTAKPLPVQAAPASVTKPVISTPPVAVASVTAAAKPLPVQAAQASVTKPVISTPPVAVASVTPAVKPVQAVPVPATVAKPAAPTPPVAVASVTPAAKPAQVLPVAATVAKPAAATLPVVVAAAVPATKPAQAVAAPAAKPVPVEASSKAAKAHENDKDDVMKVVNAWAKAWSARDVSSYLDFYAHDFQTPNGMSHKAWVDERTLRIKGKGRISVSIENPQVTINEKTATVVFRQVYVSDRLRANGRKTLLLVKQGGKWHIKQERANS